ncbi:hypothetical protein AKJ16_DCAP07677, partial [Drosera capensis]
NRGPGPRGRGIKWDLAVSREAGVFSRRSDGTDFKVQTINTSMTKSKSPSLDDVSSQELSFD